MSACTQRLNAAVKQQASERGAWQLAPAPIAASAKGNDNILLALADVNGIMQLHVKFRTGTLEARQHTAG
jgi:hypothetical protein